MKELKLFGMPVFLDEATGKLESANSDIAWEDYSRKYSEKCSVSLQMNPTM